MKTSRTGWACLCAGLCFAFAPGNMDVVCRAGEPAARTSPVSRRVEEVARTTQIERDGRVSTPVGPWSPVPGGRYNVQFRVPGRSDREAQSQHDASSRPVASRPEEPQAAEVSPTTVPGSASPIAQAKALPMQTATGVLEAVRDQLSQLENYQLRVTWQQADDEPGTALVRYRKSPVAIYVGFNHQRWLFDSRQSDRVQHRQSDSAVTLRIRTGYPFGLPEQLPRGELRIAEWGLAGILDDLERNLREEFDGCGCVDYHGVERLNGRPAYHVAALSATGHRRTDYHVDVETRLPVRFVVRDSAGKVLERISIGGVVFDRTDLGVPWTWDAMDAIPEELPAASATVALGNSSPPAKRDPGVEIARNAPSQGTSTEQQPETTQLTRAQHGHPAGGSRQRPEPLPAIGVAQVAPPVASPVGSRRKVPSSDVVHRVQLRAGGERWLHTQFPIAEVRCDHPEICRVEQSGESSARFVGVRPGQARVVTWLRGSAEPLLRFEIQVASEPSPRADPDPLADLKQILATRFPGQRITLTQHDNQLTVDATVVSELHAREILGTVQQYSRAQLVDRVVVDPRSRSTLR